MKIREIAANWFFTNEIGEKCETYTVGVNNVVEIREHKPEGEGDKWFYDVIFQNGTVHRTFNMSSVTFENN